MFKLIPGFTNYEIDENGEVYSLLYNKRRKIAVREPKWNTISRSWGYCQVRVGQRLKAVHRLVLQTFVGPCPEGMEARHLDGDRLNNRLSNLKWGTRKENSGEDKVRLGVSNRGERNGRGRLKQYEVSLIDKLLTNSIRWEVIAKMFRVSLSNVRSIYYGNKWGWLTGRVPINRMGN